MARMTVDVTGLAMTDDINIHKALCNINIICYLVLCQAKKSMRHETRFVVLREQATRSTYLPIFTAMLIVGVCVVCMYVYGGGGVIL